MSTTDSATDSGTDDSTDSEYDLDIEESGVRLRQTGYNEFSLDVTGAGLSVEFRDVRLTDDEIELRGRNSRTKATLDRERDTIPECIGAVLVALSVA